MRIDWDQLFMTIIIVGGIIILICTSVTKCTNMELAKTGLQECVYDKTVVWQKECK